MNGFANTFLSFLLSWIRALVSNIWGVFTSEDGGAAYQFLARHWLGILIVLCIAGFVIDRIVYLIRWRPYYVWQSKLRRLRRPKYDEPEAFDTDEPVELDMPSFEEPAPQWEEPEWQTSIYEKPDPVARYHDAEAGYARPIPPEELYAPRVNQPVHPGLDEETFRQTFGLQEEEQPRPQRRRYTPS